METPEQYTVSLSKQTALHDEIASLTSELKELKVWKRQMMELWSPIMDLMLSDKTIRLGSYLSEEALKRLKEYNALKEEITRLKGTLGVEAVRQNMELKDLLKEIIEKCDGVSNPPCYIDSILFNKIDSALSKHQPIKKDELTTE